MITRGPWTACLLLLTCAILHAGCGALAVPVASQPAAAAPLPDLDTLIIKLRKPYESEFPLRELHARGIAALPTLDAVYAAAPEVRRQVMEVVCLLGEPGADFVAARAPGAAEPLVKAVVHYSRLTHPADRDACLSSLRRVQPEAVTLLIAELRHADAAGRAGDRARAVDWLEKLGDRRAAPALIAAMEHDTDLVVRAAAARALASLPTPEGIDALAWAVHDPDLSVERAAASALGRIDDPRAHAAAFALLRDGSVNKVTRRMIAGRLISTSRNPDVVARARRLEPWFFPGEWPLSVILLVSLAAWGGLFVAWAFLVHLAGVLSERFEKVRPLLAVAWLLAGLIPFWFGFMFSSKPKFGAGMVDILMLFILGPAVLGLGMLVRRVMRRWSNSAAASSPSPVVVELIALYGGYLLGVIYRLNVPYHFTGG